MNGRMAFPMVLIMLAGAGVVVAQEQWKPAAGPLMTRWAKDVSADKALPEYPRPQMVRKEWKNLNGLWDYAIAARNEAQPGAWQGKILVPFPIESALSGVMKMVNENQRIWYRRSFEVPKDWAGKRVLLHFGAVDWEAGVWLNGKELGKHQGGYDGFNFDLTDALKAEGQQELIVSAWDPSDKGPQPRGKQVQRPGGIFYTPTSGIWQTVWIEPAPMQGHIRSLTILPDLDKQSVNVSADIGGADGAFEAAVLDGGNELAKGSGTGQVSIKVPDPKLWTPDSPHLYDLRIKFQDDEVQSYFGMRKLSVAKDDKGITRLMLNNQFVFQVGFLDQGFWPDGLYTAPTDEALKYDIEVTKKLGMNLARKHVKVEPERWYYWCDKLGLLVWQDMPSGDRSVPPRRPDQAGREIQRTPESVAIYERELKAMIDGRRNHPSIVMWVVFNEGWGQFDTPRITNMAKELDPSRWVNCASGWNDFPAGDVIDMHNYPGPGSPKPTDQRAAVLGEFGGLGLPVQDHLWDKTKRNWGYQAMTDRERLTRRYAQILTGVNRLKADPGLCAAVYTQTTDVETEVNGLMTYDREMIKPDAEIVAKVNRGEAVPIPQYKEVVATSKEKAVEWRYTTADPGAGWHQPEFDASAWKTAPGGFGTEGTPGAVVRTTWNRPEIWLRREFELPAGVDVARLDLRLHHDEDALVYLNGIVAARVAGYTTDYEELSLPAEAQKALNPGAKNLIAIRCKQTTGGQYIDAGLVELQKIVGRALYSRRQSF